MTLKFRTTRRFVIITLLSLLAAFAPIGLGRSQAVTLEQQQRELDRQAQELNKQYEDASQDEVETQRQLDAVIARQNSIADQINGLDKEIDKLQEDVFAAQVDYQKAEEEYLAFEDEYFRLKHEADDSVERVKAQAVDMFTGHYASDAKNVSILLGAQNLADLQRRQVVLGAVADHYDNVLEESIIKRNRAEDAELKSRQIRDKSEKKRNEIAEKQGKLQAQRLNLDSLNQQARKDAAEQAKLLEKLRGQKVQFLSRLRQIQQESNTIRKLLGKGKAGTFAPGVLGYPVSNPSISSSFGPRMHPIFHEMRMHTGADFHAPAGTPLMAAANGEVVFSGVMRGYGNVIIIDHGGGMATLYAHQSVRFAQLHDEVVQGQIIGLAGATGYATGPHLHFEVRINGTPVNPVPYFGYR